MFNFIETSRIVEAKIGDFFYKMIIETTASGHQQVMIMRTKMHNERRGFGAYGAPPAVQTVTDEGKWGCLLVHELRRFPSQEAAMAFIEA